MNWIESSGGSGATDAWFSNSNALIAEATLYTNGARRLLVTLCLDLFADALPGSYTLGRITIVEGGVTTYLDSYATAGASSSPSETTDHFISPITFIVQPGGTYRLDFTLTGLGSTGGIISCSRKEF